MWSGLWLNCRKENFMCEEHFSSKFEFFLQVWMLNERTYIDWVDNHIYLSRFLLYVILYKILTTLHSKYNFKFRYIAPFQKSLSLEYFIKILVSNFSITKHWPSIMTNPFKNHQQHIMNAIPLNMVFFPIPIVLTVFDIDNHTRIEYDI